MRKLFIVSGLLMLLPLSLQAKIVTERVNYSDGEIQMKGYLAYDSKIKTKRPGILVVHEWWGHNAYVEKRARMLAKLGYTAFALDMYGNGKNTEHPEDAGKFAGEVRTNMPAAEKRFMAAYKLLQTHKTVDKNKISAIGYCFGGGIVLEMARRGVDLDAVVSFHGSLGTASPAKKGQVKAKVLVLNGESDPFTTAKNIADFKAEMKAAGVDYKFISYPGAKHAFTNKDADKYGKKYNLPMAYNAKADKKSWNEMKKLFKEIY